MRMLVSVPGFTAKLLAALALARLAGCGSSTTGGSSGSGGSAGPPASLTCADPKASGNIVSCSGGWEHRVAAEACVTPASPGSVCMVVTDPENPDAPTPECATRADCPGGALARCSVQSTDDPQFPEDYCGCTLGCSTDADCGPSAICLCGATDGRCVPADCRTDADCGPGLLCAEAFIGTGECSSRAYRCQTPDDTCMIDDDCWAGDSGAECTYTGTHRACAEDDCGIGRPFLVDGRERLSPIIARDDWHAHGLAPDMSGLDAATRAALSACWAANGAMEHASIAAFARFVLQLLSLGAPAELIRDARAALDDELRHAEVSFALATAYAGGAGIGPGPLDMTGALAQSDARTILVTAIHEGCIGETVAALEAAEAAARAQDPVVRAALEGIAAEEARHAELAYRFVRWAIDAIPGLHPVARAAFQEALAAPPAARTGDEESSLAAHGFPGDALRREIRAQALAGVVAPCAEALLARAQDARGDGAPRAFAPGACAP